MRLARLPALATGAALLFGFQFPIPAAAAQTLTIGVDHFDPANQVDNGPGGPAGRVFEYTDFFSRQVTVHSGDTIDFQSAPGSFHIVALARDENWARRTYPVALADNDGGGATDLAIGSGTNKLAFGLSNFPITGGSHHGGGTIDFTRGFGPPACGVALLGESNCTFSGGQDVEVLGPEIGLNYATGTPGFADQLVNINAQPGRYHYFCFIHPGMRGVLDVVGAGASTTTQSQIDAASTTQFASDQAQALAAEAAAQTPTFTGGARGTRTYLVHTGLSAADNRVAIDEMLPAHLNLASGDRVQWVWDNHNVHSVTFPAWSAQQLPPFGFDCGTSYSGIGNGPPQPCLEPGDTAPEFIGDPGNAPPGTVLSNPANFIDAGVMGGVDYGVSPSASSWWAQAGAASAPGDYHFQCTIHDWMQGTLTIGA